MRAVLAGLENTHKKFLGRTTILKPCFHSQSPFNSIAQFPLFMLNFGMKCTLKFTAVVSALSRKSNSCCYLCYRTDIGLKSQLSPVPKHPICLPTWLGKCFWRFLEAGNGNNIDEEVPEPVVLCRKTGHMCRDHRFLQCHCFSEDWKSVWGTECPRQKGGGDWAAGGVKSLSHP